MTAGEPLDLVVLVPGKDERETLDSLLSARRESLGISPVRHQILVHPRRDAGCFHESPAVLEPYCRRAGHALVLFDLEGCGQEHRSAAEVEEDVVSRLSARGWQGRAGGVVIDPELEIWLWSDSPRVDAELSWTGRSLTLREWLRSEGWWQEGDLKPGKPKEALEKVLREVRLQRSSAIYGRLAKRVSLERCRDESFHRLCNLLRSWFPVRTT
ncbi:MAG TPA: hypothetical protein VLQ45_09320 [Thermoanaerobaculia bacterium]|nr:hypothetical protein [Thermoanaerobaculia bacterium]